METASATTMTQQEGLNQVVINKVQRMIDGKADRKSTRLNSSHSN